MIYEPKLSDLVSIEAPNFTWKECLTSRTTNLMLGKFYVPKIFIHQLPLFSNIVSLAQTIRDHFKVPVFVTNCYRDEVIYKSLISAGYQVSQLRYSSYHSHFEIHGTDHSFLNPNVNPLGVGAIDFTVSEKKLLYDIYQYMKRVMYKYIGQGILYVHADTNKPIFIHMSNPKHLVFSGSYIQQVFSRRLQDTSYKFFVVKI